MLFLIVRMFHANIFFLSLLCRYFLLCVIRVKELMRAMFRKLFQFVANGILFWKYLLCRSKFKFRLDNFRVFLNYKCTAALLTTPAF
jgi:hypothetical protein